MSTFSTEGLKEDQVLRKEGVEMGGKDLAFILSIVCTRMRAEEGDSPAMKAAATRWYTLLPALFPRFQPSHTHSTARSRSL